MLAVHPDMTWLLRGLTVVALVAGWFVFAFALAAPAGQPIFWLFVAAIAPALLRLLAGREGPVLDIVWMAGLAGALLRTTQWSRWTMPFPWNVLIGGWTLALSLSWPVLVAREIGFRVSGFHDAGAINSWSLMSAPQAAVWILYVVLAQLIGALWFEWAREKAAQLQSPILLNGLWAGATVASVVAVLQGTIDLGLLSTEFWASLRRATGRCSTPTRTACAPRLPRRSAFSGCEHLAPQRACRSRRRLRRELRRHVAVGIAHGAACVRRHRHRRADHRSLARTAIGVAVDRHRPCMWIPAGVLAVLAVMLLTGDGEPDPARARHSIRTRRPRRRCGIAAATGRSRCDDARVSAHRRRRRQLPHPRARLLAGDGQRRAAARQRAELVAASDRRARRVRRRADHRRSRCSWHGAWSPGAKRERRRARSASTVRGLLLGLGVDLVLRHAHAESAGAVLVLRARGVVRVAGTRSGAASRDRHAREPRVAWIVAAGLAIAYAAGHLLLAAGPLHVGPARAAGEPRLRHRRVSARAAAGRQRVPLDGPGRAVLLDGEGRAGWRSASGPIIRTSRPGPST